MSDEGAETPAPAELRAPPEDLALARSTVAELVRRLALIPLDGAPPPSA